MTLLDSLSPRALAAPESGIVEIINYARGRDGLLPLWAGEGDDRFWVGHLDLQAGALFGHRGIGVFFLFQVVGRFVVRC